MRCETGSPNFLVSGRREIDYSRAPCLGADQRHVDSGNEIVLEENHIVVTRPSFSKSSVFKMLSVQIKTQSRRFQTPSGLKSVKLSTH